jgi:ABC-type multidrug transport system fused ATPase/permease subunit
VLKSIKLSLSFLTRIEKLVWFALVVVRSTLAFLDIAAIAAIGYLATAIGAIASGGVSPQVEFAGITLPSVTNQTLPILAAIIIGLFVSKSLLNIALTGWAVFFVAKIESKAAKRISEIRFNGNLAEARKYSLEEMMFAVTNGTSSAFNSLLNSVNNIFAEGVLFVSLIVMGFFFVDSSATLIGLLYFGIVALTIQYFIGPVTLRAQVENYHSSIKLTTSISNLLAVFRELTVSGKKVKYVEDIHSAKIKATNSAAKSAFLATLPRHIIEAALIIGIALFFLAQVSSGDLASSAGKIGVFLAGAFRLTTALLPLQASFLSIKAALPSAKIAHDILRGLPELVERETKDLNTVERINRIEQPIGAVFEDVTFSYPDSPSPALVNLSFTIEPGSQTALMGPSGAGKSTIADMLCLLLTPSSGRVLQITNTSSSELERSIGGRVSYVPQKPGMISGTILENVALGIESESVDRQEVISALQAAHLGSLINELPEGIDTSLGKLKDSLSGGQMQRLGLARAIFSKPNLLVMDEATSALDAESESEIQKTLEEMRGRVTVVVIAHRLNTIQHADKVILLEDGKVTDSGTFKELIARNPSVEKVVDLMRIDEGD